ncbi:hypothetical protein ACQKK5_08140 [Brevibacillus panacihumi]|uniref:hypothetical protein n=1 Tax=Brevibacillus panacihumi TaxID=497735 RepID=UPI003D088C58
MKKTNVWIYLKNGSIIELYTKEFKATRNGFGDLTNIEWTLHDVGDRRLLFIDLKDVAAIVG